MASAFVDALLYGPSHLTSPVCLSHFGEHIGCSYALLHSGDIQVMSWYLPNSGVERAAPHDVSQLHNHRSNKRKLTKEARHIVSFASTPMSVTLNFPLGYEHDGEESLWLIRARDDDDDELQVDEMCLMQSESSDRFDLFLGSLVLPTGPERVVCKIAYTKGEIKDIQREFIVYEALEHLQGKVVPRCFGYFEWPDEAGCIIMEYAGEPLSTCFECVAEDVK